MKIRLAIIAFILSVFAISSCKQPLALQYKDITNIQLRDLSLKPAIGLDVLLYNPNGYSVTVKGADLGVWINNKHIGDAELVKATTVPGLDSFIVPVRLNADLSGIFGNAYSLLSNKEVDVRIQGSIKAGKGVFINIPINWTGRKKLNVVDFTK